MNNYRLSNLAVKDLNEIWLYTCENWSEKQADSYYSKIKDSCKAIADNSNLGKSYSDIRKDLLGYRVQKHIIFYRKINNDLIEIIRILHLKMDLGQRLK